MYIVVDENRIETIKAISKTTSGLTIYTTSGTELAYNILDEDNAYAVFYQIHKMLQEGVGVVAHAGIEKAIEELENVQVPDAD